MADENIDLRDLLNKPMSEFPDMPNLPGAKTFFGKLISMTSDTAKNEKQTPFYRFDVRLTDPGKDVTESEMAALTTKGFSLADYNVFAEFYLTPKSMVMLRRFLVSLGFAENMNFFQALKLDENGDPTADSNDLIRGMDIICKTQRADQNGRVYQRLDFLAGSPAKA